MEFKNYHIKILIFLFITKFLKISIYRLDIEQMIEDENLAVEGKVPVHFIGRMGGMILSLEDILHKIESIHESLNSVII